MKKKKGLVIAVQNLSNEEEAEFEKVLDENGQLKGRLVGILIRAYLKNMNKNKKV